MTTPRRQRMPRFAEQHRRDAYDYAGEIRELAKQIGALNTKIDGYANTREELRHDMHHELDRLRLSIMDLAGQIQLGMTLAGQGREPEEDL